jgi:hypothetical protein
MVATWQLKALGYSQTAISDRAAAGRLHRRYRGVYAVGHRLVTRKGLWMAAVLACGPDALLSHRSAIVLWDLRPNDRGGVDVTVPGRSRRGQTGIAVHNVRQIHADDRAVVDAIPVTSVHRALLDFAEVGRRQELRWALEASDRLDLLDMRKIEELCARSPGRRGVKTLLALAAVYVGPAPETRSENERRFLGLVREAGIPVPSVNVVVEGLTVDFFWPKQRLVVEVDGYRYHKSRPAFEDRALRDATLKLARYDVVRFTEKRVKTEPGAVAHAVKRLLSASEGRSGP